MMEGVTALLARLLYGTGMRLMEGIPACPHEWREVTCICDNIVSTLKEVSRCRLPSGKWVIPKEF